VDLSKLRGKAMFDILMYLFESLIHNDAELHVDQEALTEELVRAGFHHDEIYKALAWLEKLAALGENEKTPYLTHGGTSPITRVYCDAELRVLDAETRGFIMFLEQIHVLDNVTREMVIDRIMEIDTKEFCVEDLKWVVLMVLFNVPGKETAYSQMEHLLFESPDGVLH
jgi:Smg protein